MLLASVAQHKPFTTLHNTHGTDITAFVTLKWQDGRKLLLARIAET